MTQKRITIRLSEENERKLQEVAQSYGMSVSSLGAFIIGQWLHNNYMLRDKVIESLSREFYQRLESDSELQKEFGQFVKWVLERNTAN